MVLDSSDVVNLRQNGIRFAWSIEGYSDKELKNDPRYVKTYLRLAGRTEGASRETILEFHKCTWDDLKDFAPPA